MVAPTQTAACSTKAGPARLLRRLFGNQRGSISIIAAASLPVLLGFGGLAVDASLWLRAKNGVQGAADVAASSVAAAVVVSGGGLYKPCTGRMLAEARGVAAANGYQNGANGVVVTCNHPPTSGTHTTSPYAPYAYEVIITAPQQLYLANYFNVAFGLTAPTVQGRAVALNQTNPTCILALNELDVTSGTLTTSGGANLTATKCYVSDDSPNAKSINTAGGGSITAAWVSTVGGVSGNVTATNAPVQTGADVIPDPYAGNRSIPATPTPVCTGNCDWSGRINNPGVVYYNGNVTVGGSGAQLDPGVYIINGNFSSSNSLSGTGVTIVITGNAGQDHTFSMGGSGTLTLTAPTTGTTAGIALWINPTCTAYATGACNSNNLTGNTTPNITGAIYAPGGQVKFAGSSQSASTGCTQVIAYQIVVTGDPVFYHDCAGVAILDPLGPKWSLVE